MVDLEQSTRNLGGFKNPQFPKSKNSKLFVLTTYILQAPTLNFLGFFVLIFIFL
jgi:hypothetical protein